jgi:hypothetical protein
VHWPVPIAEAHINTPVLIEEPTSSSSSSCGRLFWRPVRRWTRVTPLSHCVRRKESSSGLGLATGCLYCIIVDFAGTHGRQHDYGATESWPPLLLWGKIRGSLSLAPLTKRAGWAGLDRLEWLCINLRWMMVFSGLIVHLAFELRPLKFDRFTEI